MLRRSFVGLVQGLALLVLIFPTQLARAGSEYGISGPFVHQNLAVYMMLGPSRDGPVPLTLQEALAEGSVELHETGNVSQLQIENLGDREVFIQAGDLVKGGQQDRVLTVSLLLPPRSGAMEIGSLCVERDRWGARGAEESSHFTSADFVLPSREAKLAIRTTDRLAAFLHGSPPATSPQGDLWDSVAAALLDLSASVGGPVASPESPSSLQLALESQALNEAAGRYVEALRDAGTGDSEVVGYAFAINGKLNSAEVFPSHGLFTKLWPKLLQASATEAIAERDEEEASSLPSSAAVQAFLEEAEGGKPAITSLSTRDRLETRESAKSVFFETSSWAAGDWVHRSYIANW